MKDKSWDPLLRSDQADSEIIAAAKKREIKNILKSYVGKYDAFSELIQNAMDAVDRRETASPPKNYQKKLWLTVDLQNNHFSIVDNGIGFNEKELESFLAPNISFKDGKKTRGSKGVGATYIAYGFNSLQFGTKTADHTFNGELQGGREWVDDVEGVVTRPIVKEVTTIDPNFKSIDRGSYFRIIFGGKKTRPADLNWYTATTAEQWLYLLLIKTPLGFISDSHACSIKFDLLVIDKAGNKSLLEDQECGYIFPHTKIKASVDLKAIKSYQAKMIEADRDAAQIPAKYLRSNGIYQFYSTADLLTLAKNNKELAGYIEQYSIHAYAYFTYSTAVWDQFNDTLAKLRKGYRVMRGGLQLANNGMVQGEILAIPLTSNIGYQNQTHIIVHFTNADPDLGRKGFQPELKNSAEDLSVSIVNQLKKWKFILKSDSGVVPNIAKELDLHEWVKLQEEHEQNNPLTLTNKSFFAPVNEISITSTPQSEQDVVVLFNQLLAGGVIRGIKLLATSQRKQYDGVFRFEIKKPLSNHTFDKENNPLGVEELHYNKENTGPPKILEYKYNLDGLIREFESDYKSEKEIHLAVCWEIGVEWRKNYEVITYLDLDNLHLRDFHGLTHVLQSGNTKFYVIVLKELMNYLNDVDGVQTYQRATYGSDLFDD